ncbi:MAG: zinc ribbon domain-containing protein [Proteobacteria bacterium]|nr:zinc ribbon domain-containing protein [Pseudomonadota bacterium]
MPTYEFVCEKCKHGFSLVMSISDHDKKKYKCPKCNQKKNVKQVVTGFRTITSKKG